MRGSAKAATPRVFVSGGAVWVAALAILLCAASLGHAAKTTVEFWQVWGEGGYNAIAPAILEFEAANPDIEVNILNAPQGNEGVEKLMVAIAGGVPPDITMFVSPIADIVRTGLLMPLDDMLAASALIRDEDYPNGFLNLFQFDGRTYAIPGVEVGPWSGLVYNITLYDAAGLAPVAPQTLDDLVDTHKKLTRAEADNRITQIGIDPLAGMSGWYLADIWTAIFDIGLYNPETQRLAIDTPEMYQLVDYIQRFYEMPAPEQYQQFYDDFGSGWFTDLKNGHVAMQIQGYFAANQLRDHPDEWGFGWMPNVRGDRMMVAGGWGLSIPNASPNPEAAFRVIEFMTSPAAAKHAFQVNGWINGNLTAMRSLDPARAPGIEFFAESMESADRIVLPPNIPMIIDVRNQLLAGVQDVVNGVESAGQALPRVEQQLQARLNESLNQLP